MAAAATAYARQLIFHMPTEGLVPIPVGSMASAMSFEGFNSGSQMGVNYGSVTNHFHMPGKQTNEINPRPCKSTEKPN